MTQDVGFVSSKYGKSIVAVVRLVDASDAGRDAFEKLLKVGAKTDSEYQSDYYSCDEGGCKDVFFGWNIRTESLLNYLLAAREARKVEFLLYLREHNSLRYFVREKMFERGLAQ